MSRRRRVFRKPRPPRDDEAATVRRYVRKAVQGEPPPPRAHPMPCTDPLCEWHRPGPA